jgi:hypothetical protein
MVRYTTRILRFEKQGEKTGWSYIVVPADLAEQLKPGTKTSFRVKGKLDAFAIKQTALLPMGEGEFIIPINAGIRRGIGKKEGAMLNVTLEEDKSAFTFNPEFMACLKDEPAALKFFKKLAGSHQKYFSKWIDSAKTDNTKAKRIAMSVNALAKQMGYPQMLRAQKANRIY